MEYENGEVVLTEEEFIRGLISLDVALKNLNFFIPRGKEWWISIINKDMEEKRKRYQTTFLNLQKNL